MKFIARGRRLLLRPSILPLTRAPKMLKSTHSRRDQDPIGLSHLHQILGKTHISKVALRLLQVQFLLVSASLIIDIQKNLIGTLSVININCQLLIALRDLLTLATQTYQQHHPKANTEIASLGHTQTTLVTWQTRSLSEQN